MIVVGSRYEDGNLQPVLQMGRDAGTTKLAVFRAPTDSAPSRYALRFRSGERWDFIAMKTLGDSSLWWQVMDSNPEIIDPFSVTPGTRINVP